MAVKDMKELSMEEMDKVSGGGGEWRQHVDLGDYFFKNTRKRRKFAMGVGYFHMKYSNSITAESLHHRNQAKFRRAALSIFLIILLLLCLSSCSSDRNSKDSGNQIINGIIHADNLEYTPIDKETVALTGYTGNDADLTIPETVGNYKVTKIADAVFLDNSLLKSITLPDSIEQIGENPFCGCFNLGTIKVSPGHTSLAVIDGVLFSKADKRLVFYPTALSEKEYSVPKGILIIDKGAFYGAKNLEAVLIPDSVETIGKRAFSYCRNLRDINIPPKVSQIEAETFMGCASLETMTIPGTVKSIGHSAFRISNLVNLTLGEGIQEIGEFAFYQSIKLREIIIPNSVKTINSTAFQDCISLTQVTLPSGEFEFTGNLFAGCNNLFKVNISEDHPFLVSDNGFLVNKREKKLVCYYGSGKNVEIPSGIEVLGNRAFHRKKILKVTLPASLRTIESLCFDHCENLKDVQFQAGLTTIEPYAFENCENLESIILPDTLTAISYNTFSYCSNLKDILIPTSVTQIDSMAFFNCPSLETVTIPEGVTELGYSVFGNCPNLKKLFLPKSITQIGHNLVDKIDNEMENLSISMLTIIVDRDSYAETYCKENKLNYSYSDNLEWLGT